MKASVQLNASAAVATKKQPLLLVQMGSRQIWKVRRR
jgi:hypothetical protein